MKNRQTYNKNQKVKVYWNSSPAEICFM